MTADVLARAQAGDGDAFAQLVGPYRRELQADASSPAGSSPRRHSGQVGPPG